MTRVFARIDGVLVESIGHLWAAYSPASGETALINDESAAVLELLESRPAHTAAMSAQLSADSGVEEAHIFAIVEACWHRLLDAGLIRELQSGRMPAQ